jgi:hypothetical protein
MPGCRAVAATWAAWAAWAACNRQPREREAPGLPLALELTGEPDRPGVQAGAVRTELPEALDHHVVVFVWSAHHRWQRIVSCR